MKDAPMGVIVTGQQTKETARQDFERLVSMVANGEVQGLVLTDQSPPEETAPLTTKSHNVRRGAMLGAGAGFMIGLLPLIATTVIAAVAGGLIAKASELRIEKGTAPRLHFPKRRGQPA